MGAPTTINFPEARFWTVRAKRVLFNEQELAPLRIDTISLLRGKQIKCLEALRESEYDYQTQD